MTHAEPRPTTVSRLNRAQEPLGRVFHRLLRAYGPQHWWPADTPFEVMIGAVLTQNTAWGNVERAIAQLRARDALDAETILSVPPDQLAAWIRPSGYFNVKARRLRGLCAWYAQAGGIEVLREVSTDELRTRLLSVQGVGRETADDILLYAFGRPVFVIDAYTRRIFSRLGLVRGDEDYETLRHALERSLGPDPDLYNEYHALLVTHGKQVCRARPRCQGCCLARTCPAAG